MKLQKVITIACLMLTVQLSTRSTVKAFSIAQRLMEQFDREAPLLEVDSVAAAAERLLRMDAWYNSVRRQLDNYAGWGYGGLLSRHRPQTRLSLLLGTTMDRELCYLFIRRRRQIPPSCSHLLYGTVSP